MNRSAEPLLGKFLKLPKRAEAVLGAATARFIAPKREKLLRRILPRLFRVFPPAGMVTIGR